jgi:hypothetical protein
MNTLSNYVVNRFMPVVFGLATAVMCPFVKILSLIMALYQIGLIIIELEIL